MSNWVNLTGFGAWGNFKTTFEPDTISKKYQGF